MYHSSRPKGGRRNAKRNISSSSCCHAVCNSRKPQDHCETWARRHGRHGNREEEKPWNHSARYPKQHGIHLVRVHQREKTGAQPHHDVHHKERERIHSGHNGNNWVPRNSGMPLAQGSGVPQATLEYPRNRTGCGYKRDRPLPRIGAGRRLSRARGDSSGLVEERWRGFTALSGFG